ncbi:MAG: hypothetical protein HYY52_00510 [Candidatus Melainabacteria bacterium]|nr:hypothetical protein [Candidatus Melainabacteria bacterium]
MSVGNPSLTGIPKQATPVVKQVAQNNQANNNTSARQAAIANATRPSTGPAVPAQTMTTPAVVLPGAPAIARAGGTTTPGTRGVAQAQAAPTQGQAGTVAAAMAMAASPALLAAMGAAALTSKGKVFSISGDAEQDVGNVGLGTESEEQVDALVEVDAAEASAEGLSAANSTGQPAT